MATLAEIAAKSTSALTAAERDKLREVLDFQAETTDTLYPDLEAKITALSAVGNQRARAYIDDWDVIPVAPVTRSAGSQGEASYSKAGHEQVVRDRLRLLLGYAKEAGSARAGGIGRIPVGWDCGGYGGAIND